MLLHKVNFYKGLRYSGVEWTELLRILGLIFSKPPTEAISSAVKLVENDKDNSNRFLKKQKAHP